MIGDSKIINSRTASALIIVTTILSIAITLVFLSSGIYSIFQNLFYIPIILACIFWLRRGLLFSILLSLLYLLLLLAFAGFGELENGIVRTILFIAIASLVTILAERIKDGGEALMRSEEKYRDLAENAPIGIVTCDREGNITYVNSRVPQMFGSPSIETIKQINLLQTAKVVRAGFADILKDVIENGAEYPDLEIEYTSLLGKEIYLRMNVSPLIKNDRPEGARLIIDDITKRKEAKVLLERTQFAFDHSPDEIYFVNREGKVIYANVSAQESFGIKQGIPIETTVFDINPVITQRIWEDLWSDLIDKDYVRFESIHRHPDEIQYPVDIIMYLIAFGDEDFSCTIARDISERKAMETQISTAIDQIQANVEQLAILNDEIRNPLTVIVAYAEDAPEDIRENILNRSREIDDIIKRLDREWLKSEKIWAFLHKYYGVDHKEELMDQVQNQN